MHIISEQLVEKTRQKILSYKKEKSALEFTRLCERQPDLANFITEFTQDQKQETIERCMLIFFVICRIFENSVANQIDPISFDEIETIFEKNEALVVNMKSVHERFFERITKVRLLNQPFVMKYLIESLMEEEKNKYKLSKKETGYLFFLLITIMDVFDDTIRKMDPNITNHE